MKTLRLFEKAIQSLRPAVLCLAVSGVLVSGCKKEDLVPLEKNELLSLKYVNVDAHFCTSPRAVSKQKIKYLFILDHSQSNQPGFPNPLTPMDATSTDPSGSRRYGPLVQFVSNLVPDPNNLTYFSLIDFNDTAYQPRSLSGFDQDQNHFLNTYVTPDWIGGGSSSSPSPYDSGFTNYQAALQMAFNLIKNDAKAESLAPSDPVVAITYQIIFVSDGVPTVASSPGSADPTYTQTFLTDISPLISSLLNLKSDPVLGPFISGISLNTAYYFNGTQNTDAEALLQQMAQAGNGQYLEFGTGQSIMYQAFAPPVRNVRYNLADVWVEDKNAIAWDNGMIMEDSDGDGLPDDVEEAFGSNPFAADSDGNGVNDLVEYRTKGAPCNDSHCSSATRDPYAICDGFSPSVASDGTVTFPALPGDDLNECEKFVLGADRSTFDSNGDFIPDELAFKNQIPFIAGTNGAFLNSFGDPLNNYLKLKLGYPIGVSQNKLLQFKPRTNSLEREQSPTVDTDCYHYTANNVAIFAAGNTIKMSIIQNSSIIDNKPIMTFATHAWNGVDKTIVFSQGDFK